MSRNPYSYMDYGDGDHQTAHQGCVCLFVVSQSPLARAWIAA